MPEYSEEHPNAAYTMLNEKGQLNAKNQAESSTFINAQPLFYTGYAEADSAMLDVDGSTGGTGQKSWIYELKHPGVTAACQLRPTWNAYICPFTE